MVGYASANPTLSFKQVEIKGHNSTRQFRDEVR